MDGNASSLDEVSKNTLKPKLEQDVSESGEAQPKDNNIKKNTKSKTKPLYFWSSADVNKWLRKHGGRCYELYVNVFTEHEVTGRTLIRMTEIKLEKMEITDPEHRRELMQQILKLRLKHERNEVKNMDQKGFELKLSDEKVSKFSGQQ